MRIGSGIPETGEIAQVVGEVMGLRRAIVIENEELSEANDHHLTVVIVVEVADSVVAVAVERAATAGVRRAVLVGPPLAAVVVVDRVPGDHFLEAIPIEVCHGGDRT